MTDITLTAALASKLEALRQVWGQDTVAETIFTILDSNANSWNIPLPPTPSVVASKSIKVRLRPRHEARLSELSAQTGLSIADLAKMSLVQYLFCEQTATSTTLPLQTAKTACILSTSATAKVAKAKTSPKRAKSTTERDNLSSSEDITAKKRQKPTETSTEITSKPKGRQLLADL